MPGARLSNFFAGGPQQAFAKLRDGSLAVALGRSGASSSPAPAIWPVRSTGSLPRAIDRHVAVAVPIFVAAFATVAASDLIATTPRRLTPRYAGRFGLTIRQTVGIGMRPERPRRSMIVSMPPGVAAMASPGPVSHGSQAPPSRIAGVDFQINV